MQSLKARQSGKRADILEYLVVLSIPYINIAWSTHAGSGIVRLSQPAGFCYLLSHKLKTKLASAIIQFLLLAKNYQLR